ncbi:ATP-binding protein [Polyangium spumosum]|uniref:histidine kinase n=1 Tax=Polyangium spumosum TaxID=889282 RepID=A0A6N7Q0P5_9BACT|nr:response regulator [Polyangium spumosum]
MADSDTGAMDRENLRNDAEPTIRRPSDRDLAGVLHEVSNALTVVLGWIDRARGEIDSMPTVEDALTVAASRARHARQIVRRAIGADVPDDAPASVASILAEAAKGCEPEAKRGGVELRTSLDPALEAAHLPGTSTILQILTNLLLNAVAVSPARGSVLLDASLDGPDDVVFGVTDEGPGVPVERRANLLDAGVTTRAGGAGIGLRYAAALARESGGMLSLVRAEPSARFELRWPRRPSSPPTPPRSSRKPAMVFAGKRFLVVEDDDAVFDLLEAALTSRGATVVHARTRAELAVALKSGGVDAALCDLSPFGADVLGALGEIRETNPGARIVLISGNVSDLPGLPASFRATAVRKPFEIGEIVAALTA